MTLFTTATLAPVLCSPISPPISFVFGSAPCHMIRQAFSSLALLFALLRSRCRWKCWKLGRWKVCRWKLFRNRACAGMKRRRWCLCRRRARRWLRHDWNSEGISFARPKSTSIDKHFSVGLQIVIARGPDAVAMGIIDVELIHPFFQAEKAGPQQESIAVFITICAIHEHFPAL